MTDQLLFPYADAFEHALHKFIERVGTDFAARAGLPEPPRFYFDARYSPGWVLPIQYRCTMRGGDDFRSADGTSLRGVLYDAFHGGLTARGVRPPDTITEHGDRLPLKMAI